MYILGLLICTKDAFTTTTILLMTVIARIIYHFQLYYYN